MDRSPWSRASVTRVPGLRRRRLRGKSTAVAGLARYVAPGSRRHRRRLIELYLNSVCVWISSLLTWLASDSGAEPSHAAHGVRLPHCVRWRWQMKMVNAKLPADFIYAALPHYAWTSSVSPSLLVEGRYNISRDIIIQLRGFQKKFTCTIDHSKITFSGLLLWDKSSKLRTRYCTTDEVILLLLYN